MEEIFFCALDATELLGHDHLREPDAMSGVNQSLYASCEPLLWVNSIAPQVGAFDNQSSVPKTSAQPKRSVSYTIASALIVIIGIGIMFFHSGFSQSGN